MKGGVSVLVHGVCVELVRTEGGVVAGVETKAGGGATKGGVAKGDMASVVPQSGIADEGEGPTSIGVADVEGGGVAGKVVQP